MPSPFPTWISHSGLPQELAKASGGSAAWLLFKTIIELGCKTAEPENVDIAVPDLASITGLDDHLILDTMMIYRKRHLAKLYIPEEPGENALIQIAPVLPTPMTHAQVRALQIADPAIDHHRFCDCPENVPLNPRDPKLQEVIDLYLGHCACTMNSFTMDRINHLVQRADIGAIRSAFRTAAKYNNRSFDFIVRRTLNIQEKLNNR